MPACGAAVSPASLTAFYLQDDRGTNLKFANAKEAIGKTVGPGNWTVHPASVSGVAVYFARKK